MPKSDIILDDTTTIMEGDICEIRAYVIELDHADRRSQSGGKRRALVHGSEDEIVLNWKGDYPGGVEIHGDEFKLKAHTLELDHEAHRNGENRRRRALSHSPDDELTLNTWADFSGGIVTYGRLLMKDSSGNVRIELDADTHRVSVLNDDGHPTLSLHASGRIDAWRNGKLSFRLGADNGHISLCDDDGKESIRLKAETGQIEVKKGRRMGMEGWEDQWVDIVAEIDKLRAELKELKGQV